MDEKLLKELALAKEAGMKGMAKEFFAPTPGAEPPEEHAEPDADQMGGPSDMDADNIGGGSMEMHAKSDNLTPEQLEELMRMLEQGGQ